MTDAERREEVERIIEAATLEFRAYAETLRSALEDGADEGDDLAPFGLSDALAAFRDRMGKGLRNLLLATALAIGADPDADASDRQAVDDALAVQVGYLDRFADAVQDGTQEADGTLIGRAGSYAASAWPLSQSIVRRKAIAGGALFERRVMTSKEPCDDCPKLAAKGWVPVGTLPPVGSGTECGPRCRCFFEFSGALPGRHKPAAWFGVLAKCGSGPAWEGELG